MRSSNDHTRLEEFESLESSLRLWGDEGDGAGREFAGEDQGPEWPADSLSTSATDDLPTASLADPGESQADAGPQDDLFTEPTTRPIFEDGAAKGGNPDKPGKGGGGGGNDGGGGDTDGLLADYMSGSEDGDAGYDIWIEFKGDGWTVDLQGAFISAADYFTTVITDDIGGGGRFRGKTIDDLHVSAELRAIDGTGGVLGQAGPTAIWTANDLTASGVMQFDSADAATFDGLGLWDDIVTHEFMHVLGFGSLWNYGSHNLVDGTGYVGEAGLTAYQSAMGDESLTFIPVEQDGGSGTAGAHWDEDALGNELMTGYINSDGDPATNTDNYLSEFSVASLADLGYAISYQDYPYDNPLIA